MSIKIDKDELEKIKSYQSDKYIEINQLLSDDIETDIALLFQEKNIEYSKENVIENINIIKDMYTSMVKNFLEQTEEKWILYRETNISEIEKIKINPYINTFLSATSDKEKIEKQSTGNWNRPVLVQINGSKDIPYFYLNEKTDEIIIAPFTKVEKIEEVINDSDNQDSYLKFYNINLEAQELDLLPKEEKDSLYEEILNNADIVNQKLKACFELDDENMVYYENIRKLEQLLVKHNFAMEQENYEEDTTEEERQADIEDITRINMELESLKGTIAKVSEIRKENTNFISDWKKDVAVYLMSEFQEIKNSSLECNDENEEKNENLENTDNKSETQNEFTFKPTGNELVDNAKKEALENISMVNTLLNNIKNLITRQQNNARIAGELDSNYKALNNGFEMKNYAEELDSLVKIISNKIDNISPENEEEINKISKTNIQISTLLNYLNNPKNAIGKKITRFDEINIIEENELKKEIAETIKNIRCEAELKKLRDDIEIIEDKSKFKKFLGKITGRSKIDKTMLEQIEIRQTAIKKTFKTKMPLAYNYSIHELVAEIEMFIKENDDDELVFDDISSLRRIENILKKNFVVSDSKVISIIEKKKGKNLPLASGKLSKKEIIEIDTYRFLNRYGYDKSNDVTEPEYQDTIANEIKRIVDYIKSSGVI